MTGKAAYLFMFAVSLDPFPVFFHLLLLCGSVGKESAYNAGDPGSIPGSGRSTGKGIGYRLQDSWASLVAQLVKNLLAMGEAWVQSLGRDDPLEKGKAAHSSILAWRFPWTVSGVAELDMTEQLSFYYFFFVDDRKVLYIFQRLILYIIASIFF